MKYTAVFLDFDDTLIDTQGYAIKCLEDIYERHNVNEYYSTLENFLEVYLGYTQELWTSYALGKIDKETLLKDRFGKPFKNFTSIKQSYIDEMNEDFISMVVNIDTHIEGADEVLKYLKSKYKVVMLSNGFSELQYDKLESVGFTEYFDEVILSDVVGVNKPHPDIFNYALEKAKATAETSIMIGDNILADIEGAMKSNIDQIWYNPHSEETSLTPTHVVLKLEEILDIL